MWWYGEETLSLGICMMFKPAEDTILGAIALVVGRGDGGRQVGRRQDI